MANLSEKTVSDIVSIIEDSVIDAAHVFITLVHMKEANERARINRVRFSFGLESTNGDREEWQITVERIVSATSH